MSVKRTIRMDDYLNSQFEEYMNLNKSIFGEEATINSMICGLILKGMISDLNHLSILFEGKTDFGNQKDKEKMDKLREKYKNLINNLDLYRLSR